MLHPFAVQYKITTVLAIFLLSATSVLATSHYVYHEATTNNPGCGANNYRSVLTPGHNQALTIAFKAEYQFNHNQARVYYTTDGSTPAGTFGVGSGTTMVISGVFSCTFNSGGNVDVITATIPGQPGGTTVKYIVSAWDSNGGDEIFGNGPGPSCGGCGTVTNNSSLATVFSYTVPCPATGSIWYVNGAAASGGNGASWGCAFQNLQDAIAAASTGHEIWVAAGTYKPTTGTDRNVSYSMKNGVAIYGGFLGTETMLSQRNHTANATILSGDIGAPGNSDNSCHIFFNSGLDNTAVLDGFTIRDGYANGIGCNNYNGGGMINITSSPLIRNCYFLENTSAYIGGAMYNFSYATPILTNCTFKGNEGFYGGAIGNDINGNPFMVNCILSGNYSPPGGAGGALYNSAYASPNLMNCTITGNSAEVGGAMFLESAYPALINCILWGNSSEIDQVNSANNILVMNSIVQGGYTGTGNINADPLFVSQPAHANAPTTAGDLHLQTCSPAIDAGTSVDAPTTDLDRNARPKNQGHDMGAYEFQTDLSEISVKGGSPLIFIVDGDVTPSTTDQTDFGNVTVNGSLVRTFTIFNTGNADLTVSSITSSNPQFTIGALSPASPVTGPSGSATFTVTFLPTATGVQNATITINNNDCNEAVYDFAVTGNGIVPGAALNFDGTDDLVDLGTGLGNFGTGDFTVETWFKVAPSETGYRLLIAKRGICAHANFWDIVMNAGKIYFEIDENTAGDNYLSIATPLAYNDNNWHHVACTRSGTAMKIYMDGALVVSGNTAAPTNLNNAVSVKVGNQPCGMFAGSLDELRIWTEARSCDQISQLRNCELTGSEPNLVAYYKFNQGFAAEDNTTPPVNTLTDATANANHGTLSNNFALNGATSNWVTPGGVTTGTSCPAVTAPDADVQGGSPLTTINDGDITPSTGDHTDFGNVNVNGSLVRTFTIFNTGNANLTVSSITSSNPTFTIGVLSPASPVTGPSGSATFTVTFNPTAAGVQNATITVNSNDCDEAVYDFAVTGKGVVPGAALSFDGTDDYVDGGSLGFLNGATAFTVESWVKRTAGGYIYPIFFAKNVNGTWATDAINIGGWSSGGGIYARIAGAADAYGYNTDNTILPADTWVHIAVVYDGSASTNADRLKIYAGGNPLTLSFAGTIPAATSSVASNVTVGNALGSPHRWKGDLDEMRVWSRALCQAEVQNNLNCELTTAQNGLQAYYKFNQGIVAESNPSVTTLTDASGNGKHGTLTNFALTGATSNWAAPGGVTTGSSCPAYLAPEIDVQGNSASILDGDNTPSTTDHTDFGNVAVNGSLVRTFTIYNTGNADLTINSITSSNNTLFSVGALSQASPIQGGGSATFTVTFLPTATGVQNATITINNNDCDEAVYDFVVTGKGATPASALHFDGVNDDVMIPHSSNITFDLNQDFTVSLHVKIPSSNQPNTGNIDNDIVEKVGAGGGYPYVIRYYNHTAGAGNNGKIIAARWNGSTAAIVTSTVTLNDDTWHHIAFVKSGPTLYLYVDGVLNSTTPDLTTGSTANTAPLYLGSRESQINWFNGSMDNLSIWNIARSCEEIRQQRNCELTGSESGLAAYYNFNHGFANENNSGVTTLTDAAGGDNNGTLSNNFALTGTTSNWVTPGGVTTGTSCPVSITAPEIAVQGGSPLTNIMDGDNMPSTTDHTDFNGTFTRTFTILNTGNANLTVGSITSSNPKFTIGALTPAGPISGPSGSSTFTVTYNPTDATAQTATITVNSDDCDEAAYDFAISATAVAGAALDFDGANDEVTIGSLIPAASSYTKEAWVFADQTTGNNIIGSDQNPFWVSTGGRLAAGNGNNYTAVQDPASFPTGTWVHVAVVYDAPNATMKLFKNGAMVAQSTSVPAYTGGMMAIGSFFPGSGGYKWDGKIDEVRIWNRVLCQAEIQNNMNCELPSGQTGLLAYYKFNQGFAGAPNPSVTTLTDASGNSNTGTLTNFSLTGSTSNWTAPGGVTTGNSCAPYLQPGVNVQGGSPLTHIMDGDNTPSTTDHTDFNGTFTRTFTILNTGNANLTVSSITTSNPKFTIGALTPAGPISGPSGSSTFTVTYVPTDGTAQTSTITVNSDDCDEAAYDFAVTATATPAKALHIGTGDNVHSPSFTAFGTQPATIEFWAKNEGSFTFPVGFAGQYLFLFSGGNLSIRKDFVGDYNTGATVSNTGTVWEHFALTYDGNGTFRAYKNGLPTPNPTHSAAGWGTAHTGTLQIGEPKSNYPYVGAIDEVRMWNEQRTDAQILASYNTEIASMSPCLKVYWKFNQGFVGANNGTVTTATDAANAVNHDGTLTGFALTGATGNWVAGSGIAETASAYTPAPEADLLGHDNTALADGTTSTSVAQGTNLGSVNLGSSSAVKTFTLQNNGTADLNVGSIGSSNPQFAVTALSPVSPIAQGMFATFTLTFTPTATGAQNATITIPNDDCDEAAYNFAVTGSGACVPPSFSACPTGPLTATTVASTCAAPVTYTLTAAGNPTPTLTYAFTGATTGSGSGTGSGFPFNKGNTTVTVTATSTCSPAATCVFTVTVTDTEVPTITCADPVTINTTANLCTGTTALTLPTYGDNCAGTLGNALHYGGSSEVTAPNTGLPTGNAARTVEFWVKIPSNTQHHIVSWGNFTCAIYPVSGVMRPHLWGSFNDVSSTALSVPLNTWTHVAYVLTGTQLIFYVNGVADAKTYTHNTGTTGSLYVGTYLGGTGQTVDEVRIWNVVRTQAQIQSTMGAELVGNEPNLVSYYKFNQGTAGGNNMGVTTLNATTGQNGTLTGFLLNGSTSNWVQALTFPTLTNNALSAYPKGTTTVTWTTTDAAGLTATCNQTVTVVDNQAPTLTAPANQSLNVIASTCAANYTIASPISDNCTGATWTYALSGATTSATSSPIAAGTGSGAVSFNKGVTTVTLNGVDAATNAAVQKTFTVTVADNEVPKVTACFGTNIAAFGQATGNSVTLSANSAYQSFTAPITGVITSIQIQLGGGASGLTLRVGDGISCGGNVLGSKAFNGVGGLQTITFDTPIPVTGGVMYNFGIIGNHTAGWATTGTYSGGQMYYNGCPGSPALPNSDLVFTVNMNYVPPISINVAPGTCAQNYAIPAPTLSDNCTGPLTWNATFSGNTNGNPANLTGLADGSPTGMISFSKGTTNVVLNGVDASGNVSTTTCPFTVTVVDNEAPTIACAGPVSINTTPGLCTGTTTLTEPTVTDNCPLVLGNGLHFDGSNDLVNASGLLGASPTQFTVEFWLNPASRSDYNQEISIGSAGNGHWNGFTFHTTAGGAVYVGTDIGSRMTPSDIPNNTVVLNTWQHFAYVFSGGTGKFYKNGVLLATKANGTPPSFDVLRIASGCCNPVHGVLDELRIWNTARTQAELLAAKNSELSGSEPNLVAYYNFNQGAAGGSNAGLTNLPDAATAISGANNGTLTGFALSGTTSNWVTGVPLNSLTNDAPATYPKGATVVTWTATDASGNTETCQQTVTVTDNEVPVLTVPAADIPLNVIANTCAANYTIASPITDNCTGATWTYSLSGATTAATSSAIPAGTGSGAISFNKGVTTVTLNGVDAATNAAVQKTFTVTVTDNIVPTISGCAGNQPLHVIATTCAADYMIPAPTLADNCAGPLTWNAAFSGNSNGNPTNLTAQADGTASSAIAFQKGATLVTLSTTDAAGNVSTVNCSFTVTVTDNEKPQITCAGPVSISTTAGLCMGTTTLVNPTVTDNCPLSPSNALAFDGSNDKVTAISPVNIANSDFTIEAWLKRGSTGSWDIAVGVGTGSGPATGCGGNSALYFGFDPSNRFAFTFYGNDTYTPTTYTDLNWHHWAATFNATTKQRKIYRDGVLVHTNTSPSNFIGGNTVTIGNTACDDLPFHGKIDEVRIWNAEKSVADIQAAMNAELVGNEAGLLAYHRFNQGIADGDNTGLTSAIATTGPNGMLSTFALTGTTSNWTAGYVVSGLSNNAPATYPKGPTVVTWTATDASGNTETCQQTVTVTDNEVPVLTVPAANIPLNVIANTCAANYTIASPVSDNCTGATWTYALSGATTAATSSAIPSGTGSGAVSFNKGVTTVTLNGVDAATNAAVQKTFTVTVTDDQPPTITCPTGGPFTRDADAGECNYTVQGTEFDPTFVDNCDATISNNFNSTNTLAGADLPRGSTTVTWTVTDGSTPSTTCAILVQVRFPEINVQGNSVDIADGDAVPDSGDHTDFGSTTGTPIVRTFTIQNTGNLDLSLGAGAITLGGTNANLFSISNVSLPTTLSGPNGSITFDVTYTPVSIATHTATVHIASNDCDENPYDFAIQGTRDCSPPTFTACPTSPVTANTAIGQCNATVTYNVTADATPAPTLNYTFMGATTSSGSGTGSGSTFEKGSTTVTVTATNPCGTPTCVFTVTVSDNEKPTLVGCPSNILLKTNDDGGADCAVTVTYTPPTFADNCDGTGAAVHSSGPASGTSLSVSNTPYTVVYTYTDLAGNAVATNCSFTVTVQDNTLPTLVGCPSNILLKTNDGGGADCAVQVTYKPPTFADNCDGTGAAVHSSGPASGTSLNVIGSPYTVVYTYSDLAGNAVATNCSFTVTVQDNTPPTITCPSSQALTTELNQCGTLPFSYSVTTTDNCSSTVSIVSGLPSGSTFPVGATTVVWKTTDTGGNMTTCQFVITVADNQGPSIVCPQNITKNTDPNLCTAVTTYANPTVSDNCTGWTLTRTSPPNTASGSAFPKGVTTVNWKITDASGTEAICNFTVTVLDAQKPAITCPNNLVRNTDAGLCTAVVTYANPTATDNCGTVSVSHVSGGASGSTFNKGVTMVQWKATDNASPANESTCSFTVTVNDAQLPSIACPSNIVTNTDPGQCHAATNYNTPTATDNCTGVTVALQSGLPSGSNFPKGQTTLVWKATDVAGLTKTCSFRVTVNDAENPVITCPTVVPLTTTANSCASAPVTYSAPTATDNCTTVTVTRLSGPASGSTFPLGNTTVIWRAIDGVGRSSTCSFAVTVTDVTPPTISCPNSISATGSGSPCTAAVTYANPTATDNCGVQSLFLLTGLNSGSVFPAGVTVNTWRAIASNGQSATCSFTVTVGCGASPSVMMNSLSRQVGNELGMMNRDSKHHSSFIPDLSGQAVHHLSLNLSPNPATTEVQIFSAKELEADGELTVYDAQGRLMWRLPTAAGQQQWQLDLDDRWQSGLYFVTLRSADQMATKRLMINRL